MSLSPARVARSFLAKTTSHVRVDVPGHGPVGVFMTTGTSEADVLLESRDGRRKMTLFYTGGGRLEQVAHGGWVQDFTDIDAALLSFARSVS
jgi:hypothetical protein